MTLSKYVRSKAEQCIILRHDVDAAPENSLEFARLENELGIKGVYYFRIINSVFKPDIIRKIHSLGHEIGYHYEDVCMINRSGWLKQKHLDEKGMIDLAIKGFDKNLDQLRQVIPVETICMHGSPLCRWDSRLLWKYYDYKDWDLKAEPYFDLDFSKMLYLTDTGRRWNGSNVSIRDKLFSGFDDFSLWKVNPIIHSAMKPSSTAYKFQSSYNFRSTRDIKNACQNVQMPKQMMVTVHPQRWNNQPFPWVMEFVLQNLKNLTKRIIVKTRK